MVSNFVVQALTGEPITIYGDGSQTRSFCYVDDLIEGFLRLMNSPNELTGPINLGNPDEFTIKAAGRAGGRYDRLQVKIHATCRCPRTILRAADPTSGWPSNICDGLQPSLCATA